MLVRAHWHDTEEDDPVMAGSCIGQTRVVVKDMVDIAPGKV